MKGDKNLGVVTLREPCKRGPKFFNYTPAKHVKVLEQVSSELWTCLFWCYNPVVFNLWAMAHRWATEVFCSGPQSSLVWKSRIYTMSCLFPDIVRKLAESCGEWRVDMFFVFVWRSPVFDRKNLWILVKTFFLFGDRLFSDGKTVSI